MEVISKQRVASVELIDVRASEDEIALCEAALSYLLDVLSVEEMENRFGAAVEEVEAIRDDLRAALTTHRESAHEPALAQAEKD
jgi:uncharacterized small protein (DUF1192 family)